MAHSYKKTLFFIVITIFLHSIALHPADDTPKKTAIGRLISNATDAWKEFWTWTGLRYMTYKTERRIIGPFFVPHNNRIYLVILVKNEIIDRTQVRIGAEDRPFVRKLPFKENYTVLKKDVTNNLGETYEITPSNLKDGKEEKITGIIPTLPGKNDMYSFLVYGDLRKRDRGRLHKIKNKHKELTSIAYKTGRMVKKEKNEAFHLITGDLVIDGGSVQEWVEFLDKVLRPAAKDTLVTSAIGNHDISSSMIALKKKTYLWFFNDTIPHFGNLFYFKKEEGKLSVKEHIEKTQGYFDIGAVRFVHLPLPTEATVLHYLENPIGKIPGFPSSSLLRKGQLSCHNFNPKIYEEFEKNILLAHALKQTGKISFIIVCGHAPLISSPGYSFSHLVKLKKYSRMHQGIINFMIDHRKKFAGKKNYPGIAFKKYVFAENIKRIFEKYSIDAYFCGHNHIYDRCTWKINENISIPMITMAVGTKLSRLSKTKKDLSELSKSIRTEKIIYRGHPKEEFIGFVNCAVNPEEKVINCSLVGEDDSGEDAKIFDAFEIKARS